MKQLVILISGRGSNLQALLDAGLPCRVAAVISNRADAEGLDIARSHAIPVAVVEHRDYPDRESFDSALAKTIDKYEPDIIALAGFMRILSNDFVSRYQGRLINIHPSLLPAYGGLNTHERALQDGVWIHGCTVHFVTPNLDHGPVIIQAAVPVLPNDTEQALAERVLLQEHRIYPQAIKWLCNEIIFLDGHGRVNFRKRKQSGFALVNPCLD